MAAQDTHKHPWHSTDMIWHSHFPQSPPWHPLTTQMPLRMSDECFGVVKAVPWGHGVCLGCLGVFFEFPGLFWGCIRALRVIWECFLLNSHQYTWCTYKSTDIFQKTWGSQMSQISKCPKVTVVLTYWEASGDVSELRYKSLLCFSSKRSYCSLALFRLCCIVLPDWILSDLWKVFKVEQAAKS